jgi:hypothetical protein
LSDGNAQAPNRQAAEKQADCNIRFFIEDVSFSSFYGKGFGT